MLSRKCKQINLTPAWSLGNAKVRAPSDVTGKPAFQLSTFSLVIMNPISMSVRRDRRRHTTRLPGGLCWRDSNSRQNVRTGSGKTST
jgi:hypothetical protein